MSGRVGHPLDPAVASFARFLRGANRSPKTATIYTDATHKLIGWLDHHAPEVTRWPPTDFEGEQISEWVEKDLSVVKIADLLARLGVLVLYRTLHRFCAQAVRVRSGWRASATQVWSLESA